MDIQREFPTYFISYCIVTLIVVYVLKIPQIITGQHKLVNEYYYTNSISSFLLDLVLIYLYIKLASYIAKVFKIKTTYKKIFIVSFITFIISASFMFLFLKQNNNLFFTRWFKSAGFYAVLYDIIIVTSLFIVNNYTKSFIIHCKLS